METIKGMADADRPREKLLRRGAAALSDKELLAVLLGSGTKGHDVFQVAASILKTMDEQERGTVRIETLRKIEGVGLAKACVIAAALEFARRRIRPEGFAITFPADALPVIRHYADRKQEHFLCLTLNGANEVIATRVIAVGTINRTQVRPREVFADAVADRAAAIIVAHNHPAGEVAPSREDEALTRELKAAGEILGVKLLDHVVFNRTAHFSFLEKGLL